MNNNNDNRFDEIDKLFENLQKENVETVDSLRTRLNKKETPDLASLSRSKEIKKSAVIKRPIVPSCKDIELASYFEYFMYLIKNVNYGSSNSQAYVKGHMTALDKYLTQANLNPTNMTLVEAAIKDEINDNLSRSKTSIEVKGYADGLNYVYQSTKKAKQAMAKKINDILKVELK